MFGLGSSIIICLVVCLSADDAIIWASFNQYDALGANIFDELGVFGSVSTETVAWLQTRLMHLQESVDRCRARGGRFIQIVFSANSLDGSNTTQQSRFCGCSTSFETWQEHAMRAKILLRSGTDAGIMVYTAANVKRKSIPIRSVKIHPLAQWEDADLRFVVAGFGKCGTNSLATAFALHPSIRIAGEVAWTRWGGGYFPQLVDGINTKYWAGENVHLFDKFMLLPSESSVRRFVQNTQEHRGPIVLGEMSQHITDHVLKLLQLQAFMLKRDNMVAVFIVRNQMDAFESYYENLFVPFQEHPSPFNESVALNYAFKVEFGRRLVEVENLLPIERVHIVAMSSLLEQPAVTFNRILQSLHVPLVPETWHLPHSHKTPEKGLMVGSFDLCKYEFVVFSKRLYRRLLPDNHLLCDVILRRTGSLPRGILLSETRCRL